jgi:hypothetical protein
VIDALTVASPDELTWELLGAYEITDGYEFWCELVGLEAKETKAERAYDLIHTAYARFWLAMGDQFFARLSMYVARWKKRTRGSGLIGNHALVA